MEDRARRVQSIQRAGQAGGHRFPLASPLFERIQALAGIGADPGGGVSRLALTRAEREAVERVRGWMEEAGMETRVDAIGNLVGTYRGTDDLPAIMTGSHLDSVPNGGVYDGVLGVLAAIECVHRFHEDRRRFPRSLHVVAFTGEEASRFPGLIGSRALAHGLTRRDLAMIRSQDGETLAEALSACGLDPDRIEEARWTEPLNAFLELHIDQGLVLADAGVPLGVVSGITGLRILNCILAGRADHAGATPMHLRNDALVGAAEIILALDRIPRTVSPTAVGTVGTIRLVPGAANVIPGRAEFSLDLRDLSGESLERLVAAVTAAVEGTARRRDLHWILEERLRADPIPAHPQVVRDLQRACRELDIAHRVVPSGAGHDAQNLAAIAPAGMLFVRNPRGISHNPAESALPEDIMAGVEVMTRVLERWGSDRGSDRGRPEPLEPPPGPQSIQEGCR